MDVSLRSFLGRVMVWEICFMINWCLAYVVIFLKDQMKNSIVWHFKPVWGEFFLISELDIEFKKVLHLDQL